MARPVRPAAAPAQATDTQRNDGPRAARQHTPARRRRRGPPGPCLRGLRGRRARRVPGGAPDHSVPRGYSGGCR
ncbi:MAG: hypothetical protein DSY84_07580, partial [Candidatus Neomarinimicrobiota bacterium]